jgi:hypothetical protein
MKPPLTLLTPLAPLLPVSLLRPAAAWRVLQAWLGSRRSHQSATRRLKKAAGSRGLGTYNQASFWWPPLFL